jgi:hypothetical protein
VDGAGGGNSQAATVAVMWAKVVERLAVPTRWRLLALAVVAAGAAIAAGWKQAPTAAQIVLAVVSPG